MRRAAILAVAAAALAACASAGASPDCVIVGYVRDATPPETVQADLRAALAAAERAVPDAGPAAADAVLRRRLDAVDAAMRAAGYRRVERRVPCDGRPGAVRVR